MSKHQPEITDPEQDPQSGFLESHSKVGPDQIQPVFKPDRHRDEVINKHLMHTEDK